MNSVRIAILLAAITLPSVASAQNASSSAKAVLALEEQWTRALVKNDTAEFRRLTVPGFVYTEDNVVMTQDELIKGMVNSGDKVTWAGNAEMKFHDYSPLGVVTGVMTVKGHNRKGEFTHRYRFTDTWLYRNGKWQAVAAQDYLIPK